MEGVAIRAAEQLKPTMCHLGFAGLPLHMHICFVHCQASSFLAAWALWYKPKLLPSATNHQHHFPLMQKWRKKACKMSAFPGSLPSMLEIMKIFNFNNRQMGSVIGRQWSQISYGFVWWLMQGMGVFFVLFCQNFHSPTALYWGCDAIISVINPQQSNPLMGEWIPCCLIE